MGTAERSILIAQRLRDGSGVTAEGLRLFGGSVLWLRLRDGSGVNPDCSGTAQGLQMGTAQRLSGHDGDG